MIPGAGRDRGADGGRERRGRRGWKFGGGVGQDGEDREMIHFLQPAGVGCQRGVGGGLTAEMVDHEAGDAAMRMAEGADGQRGVVERAQAGAADDDHGEAHGGDEVENGDLRIGLENGSHDPADAFDEEGVAGEVETAEGGGDKGEVDGLAGDFGGCGGGKRRRVTDGADGAERLCAAGVVEERGGVIAFEAGGAGAAAGGDWFTDAEADALW